MYARILSLILLTFWGSSLNGQTPAPKSTTKQNSVAELNRRQLREQAYETVKAVWTNSGNIADVRQRTEINSRAFRLVWRVDPELARAELTKNFDELLESYSSTRTDAKSRNTLETTITKLIGAMASSDAVAAQKLQQRYFEARRQLTGAADDRRDLADTLNLASDLLDTDATQSFQLASRVFE
ncbi:MAG TPA: hypothetical protein VFZ22_16780, partial [Pyrinomonadaceae bacterium]|nr:hypothetical protein [Pyrinomonadaceae bacterium]